MIRIHVYINQMNIGWKKQNYYQHICLVVLLCSILKENQRKHNNKLSQFHKLQRHYNQQSKQNHNNNLNTYNFKLNNNNSQSSKCSNNKYSRANQFQLPMTQLNNYCKRNKHICNNYNNNNNNNSKQLKNNLTSQAASYQNICVRKT